VTDVEVLDLPGGLQVPYVDVRGATDGPHLTVLAGVHGTEYTSIAAVRRLAATLESSVVAGRVTAVPVVNPAAFWARSPFVVPTDGKNLNRSFPGDADGTDADVLAARLFETFIAGSDYLLDLHAGDLPEALEPFALYEQSPVEAASRQLALSYGVGHVVRQVRDARTVAGSTCAAAADVGIPAIVAESGQNGLLTGADVDRHVAGAALPGRVRRPAVPRRRTGRTPAERARGLALAADERGRVVGAGRGGRRARGRGAGARHGHRAARPGGAARGPRSRGGGAVVRDHESGRGRRRAAARSGPRSLRQPLHWTGPSRSIEVAVPTTGRPG
jgi:hypothetical protein